MVKYAEAKVVCPFSINGRPKISVVRYMEENGKVVISAPNGCDDMCEADVCYKCMQTLHKDFAEGNFKDTYYIS